MTETELSGLAGFRRLVSGPHIPVAARLLFGAAAIDIAVQVIGRGAFAGYLSPSLSLIVNVLLNASSFVLAAAAIIGADGWPSGRRWLLAGASFFAAAGLLNLALWSWFWAETGGTNVFRDGVLASWWQLPRELLELSSMAAASFAIAIGLWKGRRPSQDRIQPSRRAVLVAIAIVGLAFAGGYLATGIASSAQQREFRSVLEYPPLAAQVLTMTAIALAAIATLPPFGRLPELTIAVGAVLIVLAKGAWGWFLLTVATVPQPWIFAVLTGLDAVQLAGVLALASGLAMGRLIAPVAPHTT